MLWQSEENSLHTHTDKISEQSLSTLKCHQVGHFIYTYGQNTRYAIETHLEDVRDVSEVKNVVEPNGSGQEVLAHFLMQANGSLDECADHATNTITVATLLEMTAQNTAVYSAQSLRTREMYSKH